MATREIYFTFRDLTWSATVTAQFEPPNFPEQGEKGQILYGVEYLRLHQNKTQFLEWAYDAFYKECPIVNEFDFPPWSELSDAAIAAFRKE